MNSQEENINDFNVGDIVCYTKRDKTVYLYEDKIPVVGKITKKMQLLGGEYLYTVDFSITKDTFDAHYRTKGDKIMLMGKRNPNSRILV